MIQYREDVVKFFREAGYALSKIEEIEIGTTYFSNSFTVGSQGFEIVRLLTDKEHWSVWNKSRGMSEDSMFTKSDEVEWFEIRDEDGSPAWHSLTDCNVGASYNPWLIFRTKEALEAYEKLQVITYSRDELDDWLDYEYDHEEA